MSNRLITAVEANATATQNSASKVSLLAAVNDQILTAASLGEFELKVDVSAQQTTDVLYVMDQLTNLKYKTSLDKSTLVIDW